jgi:hypothetical protein
VPGADSPTTGTGTAASLAVSAVGSAACLIIAGALVETYFQSFIVSLRNSIFHMYVSFRVVELPILKHLKTAFLALRK